MAGPYTPVGQGNLNRLLGSITFTGNLTTLNVYSGNLGTEGIRLSFDGNATDLLNTMTGMVTSPAPYQPCTLTVALVKSADSQLANLYKRQFIDNTIMGQVTVFPDLVRGSFDTFVLQNVALESIREMAFNGTEAVIVVTMRGYYQVNQGFFV